jgi:two-component system NtrC family sensor kinase
LAAKSQDSGVQACLTEILDDAQRCAQIVKRVLHFAQQTDRVKSQVALHPLIRMAELHTRRYVQHNGSWLRLVLAPQQPYIMAHEAEIDLALVNLIRNAVEASEPGGLVTIQTEVSGGKVYVSVQDKGRGLSKGEQQRAFDPFYTTREAAGGTGLGLSIVHRIITDHDGQIALESIPGQGTTVHVRLPLAPAGSAPTM